MAFKKGIFAILVGSQMALGSMAFAAPTATAPSPEFNLVRNIIALQGENLSNSELQAQAVHQFSTYVATSPEAGREQRMEQALVDLGVYTPSQAQSFAADAEATAARIASSNAATPEQASQMATAEIYQLAQTHPIGAEFGPEEACMVGVTGGMILGIGSASLGFLTVIVGVVYRGVYSTGPNAKLGDSLMIDGGIALGAGAVVTLASFIAGATTCADED